MQMSNKKSTIESVPVIKKFHGQLKHTISIKRMLYFFGLLLFATSLLLGCSSPETDSEETVIRTIPVEGVTATSGRLVENVRVSGLAVGAQESVVIAQVQGIITDVNLELGQKVRKGDVLLRVEDSIARLTMEQAKVQLESARSDLEGVERRFSGGTAARADLNRAQSAVKGAEVQYENAVKTYENHTLTAPISGAVASKADDLITGNLLTLNTGVTRITDTSRLNMNVGLSERELALIKPGASVTVKMDVCDVLMQGLVKAIAAGSDAGAGSFRVTIAWENECLDTVRSGMSAVAYIETDTALQGLIVPSQAVVSVAGEQAVYVYHDGQAILRPIVTGQTIGNRTIVQDGVVEGDVIIISALSRLLDEAPVALSVVGESGSW